MSFEDLKQQFEEQLEIGDALQMRHFLDHQNISDMAELVYEYPEHESNIIAGMSVHRAAGLFKILEFSEQKRIIQTLPPNKTAELLNELPADDRTAFLEELPGIVVRELIKLLEIPFSEALDRVYSGEIDDAKTVILLQYAAIKRLM